MPLRLRYVDILSGLVPAGALGVSLLLGSTPPCDAGEPPSNALPLATQGVSVRLAAIREAVSEIGAPPIKSAAGEQRLAWGNWHNGGWHNGGWGNWRNGWHNGWPNWWHTGESAVEPNVVKADNMFGE